MIDHMTDYITTKTNVAIATAAVASPWWLDHLEEISRIAALVVPILGALWLAVQIVLRLWAHFGRKEQ